MYICTWVINHNKTINEADCSMADTAENAVKEFKKCFDSNDYEDLIVYKMSEPMKVTGIVLTKIDGT